MKCLRTFSMYSLAGSVLFALAFCASAEIQSLESLLNRADTALTAGNYDATIRLLEEANDIKPPDESRRKPLIKVYLALARETTYKSDGITAFRICQIARERFSEEPSILTQWGKAALAAGKNEKEVLRAIASCLFLTGNRNNEPEIAALYQTLLGVGMTKLGDKDLLGNPAPPREARISEAIAKLQEAIKSDPRWFLPHFFLGQIYVDLNDYRQAIESYEMGLKKNPRYFNHIDYVLLGSLYNDRGDFAKAKELLIPVLTQFPYLPGVHYILAQAESGLKNPTEEYYQICYELFIGGPEGFSFKQAQQAKMQLLQKYSTDEGKERYPELWFCLEAARHGANRQWAAAASVLEQAAVIRTSPHPILHLLLGEALWQAGQLNVALSHLHKVADLDPHFPPVYVEIGDIYEQKGDSAQAKLWWEKALKTDLNNWKVQELRKRATNETSGTVSGSAGSK